MRILYVNTLYPPDFGGGAERTLAILVAGQQRAGNEVRVLTTTKGNQVIDEVVDGVPVTRIPLRNFYWHNDTKRRSPLARVFWHLRDIRNGAMGDGLAGVIEQFNPDIVSFHNLVGFSSVVWEVASRSGKPSVQVLHDYYNLCPRSHLFRDGHNCDKPCARCRAFRVGRTEASNYLTAVVSVSQATLDLHLQNGLFSEVGIRRVVNNARHFKPLTPRDYPSTARVIGFIGTVGIWKGVERLLEAWRIVRARAGRPIDDLKMLVAGAGDPPYVESLKAQYAKDNVEFLGHVGSSEFYEQVDVVVVPSIWNDPLPGVVFESLMRGIPVIGSTQGGIPEMVKHGVNGLLYDTEQPGALEQCLTDLAKVPGLLGRLGTAARDGSAHYADVDRMVAEHHAVYELALAQQ